MKISIKGAAAKIGVGGLGGVLSRPAPYKELCREEPSPRSRLLCGRATSVCPRVCTRLTIRPQSRTAVICCSRINHLATDGLKTEESKR